MSKNRIMEIIPLSFCVIGIATMIHATIFLFVPHSETIIQSPHVLIIWTCLFAGIVGGGTVVILSTRNQVRNKSKIHHIKNKNPTGNF